ncbi:uncharacterized protein Dmoj_GI11284 [Drosophila mojavensis]|uniref:Uncharacterized protein n=1 Tax=Drosophila mojavensis TaxID=7230 RepID=B4LAM3_DROMO|nr:uncharacterized protein Dmoj_GI11284 [Drosophila mojavensis]
MRIFKLFRRRGSSFYLPLLLLLLVHCICMWPVLAARDRYARQNSKQRHQDAYRNNASRARNRGGGSGNHERAAAAAAAASSAALIASGSSIGDNNKDTFPKGKSKCQTMIREQNYSMSMNAKATLTLRC